MTFTTHPYMAETNWRVHQIYDDYYKEMNEGY